VPTRSNEDGAVEAPALGNRVRLACEQVGSRRLITEITIGLGARPDGNKRLADLIKTSSPTEPGCPGGTVDPVGHQ